jgi:hypothetical protein
MSDDHIIDLAAYLEARERDLDHEGPLAVLGSEGERRRFILPLWRGAYVAGAGWVGLVREDGPDRLEAVVVIDLRSDPARPEPETGLPPLQLEDKPPSLRMTSDGAMVLALGEGPGGRRWMLVLAELEPDDEVLEDEIRENLLYLAGECAGLMNLVES